MKVTAYRFYCAGGNTSDRVGVIPTLYIPQGWTTAVAQLLTGEKSVDGSAYLHLVLGGLDFYVDITEAKQQTGATEALLRALAPDTELYWGEDGAEERVTSAQAKSLARRRQALVLTMLQAVPMPARSTRLRRTASSLATRAPSARRTR